MHPSFEVQRKYLVRVRGTPAGDLADRLLRGVMLEDGLARFSAVVDRGQSQGHSWFEVTLGEGRNREVRRAFETLGHEVSRLKRLAYGPFRLPDDLPAGMSISIADPELAQILR
jgi:23S rRNA pseudouridine2605 synthase